MQSEPIHSGDDDYLINETRINPTTGTQCTTLFDKWHGILYMLSRRDTTGHTKAFVRQYSIFNILWSFVSQLITASSL